MRLYVAGAGMAGLVAAARAIELGADVVVLERSDRPGGSMRLSSGVVWRHRQLEALHRDCPEGDRALQALVWNRLDEGIDWLRRLGAPVLEDGTGNPRTAGVRFDVGGLTDTLLPRAGDVRLRTELHALAEPLVLATGGFGALLARRLRVPLRAAPWSDGAGVHYARSRGAALAGRMDEFYGRALPAPPAVVTEQDWVRAAQVYGRHAAVVSLSNRPIGLRPAWHESDLAQIVARLPQGQAWYVVDARALRRRVGDRTVADVVAVAEEVGGEVRRGRSLAALGLEAADTPLVREPPFAAVRVVAAVTQTLGGVRIDPRARVLRDDGSAIPGLWAAGADAGAPYTGGYGSGLGAALVLGLAAAEDAVAWLANKGWTYARRRRGLVQPTSPAAT